MDPEACDQIWGDDDKSEDYDFSVYESFCVGQKRPKDRQADQINRMDEMTRTQLEHMLAFIKQEACEKVMEIEARTEEDYNLQKGKLVQHARLKMLRDYSKQEKNAVIERKRKTAIIQNAARLKLLQNRHALLEKTIAEARRYLKYIANPKNELYRSILHLLLDEGMLLMNVPLVVVTVRQIDQKLVHSLFNDASKNYRKLTGELCELRLDKTHALSDDCCGGVFLRDGKNRVKIDNTLSTRFNVITRKIMPTLRNELFNESLYRPFINDDPVPIRLN